MEGAELLRQAPQRMLWGRIPTGWLGTWGYLAAGIALGLVLIVAVSLSRREPTPTAAAGIVTDNVVHLRDRDIASSCWSGASSATRFNVALEVGVDGKVHSASAAGAPGAMRGCVESHVFGWEFLPQAQPVSMVLPFEVSR